MRECVTMRNKFYHKRSFFSCLYQMNVDLGYRPDAYINDAQGERKEKEKEKKTKSRNYIGVYSRRKMIISHGSE